MELPSRDYKESCASCLLRRPQLVWVAWLIATGVAAPFGPLLLNYCEFAFEPIAGTPSERASRQFAQDFPGTLHQDVEIALVSCREPCTSVVNNTGAFRTVEQLRNLLSQLNAQHQGLLQNWTDQFQFMASPAGRLGLKSPFLSDSNQTLLFQWSWEIPPRRQEEAQSMLQSVQDLVDSLNLAGQQQNLAVSLTGSLSLFRDTLDSTRSDIVQKDLMIIPLAMAALAWRVRTCRLLVLPLFCLLSSVVIAFALFLPLAKYILNISPLAPSIMAFLSVALAIDYSLFMLTRYVEEATMGATTAEALRAALRYSGEVITISASVLMVCYLGVSFYPGGGINTIGLGGAISVLLCTATNMTLTPALIMGFPKFFGAELFWRKARETEEVPEPPRTSLLGPMSNSTQAAALRWMPLARALTTMPGLILVPVVSLGLMACVGSKVLSYKESFANDLTFPRNSRASVAYRQLLDGFPSGELSPNYLLVPAAAASTTGFVTSEDFFQTECELAAALVQGLGPQFGVSSKDLLGISLAPSQSPGGNLTCLSWDVGLVSAQSLLAAPGDLGDVYRALWGRLVSAGNQSSLVILTLPFDAYSNELKPFVHAARSVLIEFWSRRSSGETQELDPESLLFGTLVIVYDLVEVTFQRMPYIVGGTIALVFTVISVAFRAALAPLKMFFTVVVPLFTVFGVSVWVYQDNGLQWLGVPQLQSPGRAGFYWGTPVFTCTILIGLALDYDVFLFARVVELRKKGYSNSAAVRGALCLTGPVITCAGVIMTATFFGLLLCDVPVDNQIGFVMGFGALMDTFVIRTCLVPSVLTLGGCLNYWPQQMPPETKSDMELEALLKNPLLAEREELCLEVSSWRPSESRT